MAKGKTRSFCLNSFHCLHTDIQCAMLLDAMLLEPLSTFSHRFRAVSTPRGTLDLYKKYTTNPWVRSSFYRSGYHVLLSGVQICSSDISVTETPSFTFSRLTVWDADFGDHILFSANVRALLLFLLVWADLSEL